MLLLKLITVDRKRYLRFVENHPFRNFMQYPSWGDLKSEWKWSHEFLGWFTPNSEMVGGTMVLYRKVPGLNRFLAYLPRGPLIDWFSDIKMTEWFYPLFQHLKKRHVFTVKMDPPIVRRKWSTQTIFKGLSEFQSLGLKNKKITDLPPDKVYSEVEVIQQHLSEMGWRQNIGEDSFDTVQPQFVFRLHMHGKKLDQVFAEFHPLWQKKINQAEWEEVEVRVGDRRDIHDFYYLLAHEAKQDQTRTRNITYFEKMFDALTREDPNRIRLYLARHEGHLISTALAIRVQGHTWDLYSARWNKSDHPASYLMRWKMIQDAYQFGDRIYDFRGISTTLNDQHPYFELLRFKLGFSGDACELMGEWDYPVIPMLHWAFDMYMKKR